MSGSDARDLVREKARRHYLRSARIARGERFAAWRPPRRRPVGAARTRLLEELGIGPEERVDAVGPSPHPDERWAGYTLEGLIVGERLVWAAVGHAETDGFWEARLFRRSLGPKPKGVAPDDPRRRLRVVLDLTHEDRSGQIALLLRGRGLVDEELARRRPGPTPGTGYVIAPHEAAAVIRKAIRQLLKERPGLEVTPRQLLPYLENGPSEKTIRRRLNDIETQTGQSLADLVQSVRTALRRSPPQA